MIEKVSQRLYSFRIKKIRSQEDTIHLSWGLDRDLEIVATKVDEIDETDSEILGGATTTLLEEDSPEEKEDEDIDYEDSSPESELTTTEDEEEGEKSLVEMAEEDGDLSVLPMEDEEGIRYLKVFYPHPTTSNSIPNEQGDLFTDFEDWVEVEFHSVREGLYELRSMPRNY
jgi:hypothetical protein